MEQQTAPRNVKVMCSCGFEVAIYQMNLHLNSERHEEGADPEGVVCECSCVLKNRREHRKHLKTEKHTIMLNNGGNLKACLDLQSLRGIITSYENKLKKLEHDTDEWNILNREREGWQSKHKRLYPGQLLP